jgi:hypothetical protein
MACSSSSSASPQRLQLGLRRLVPTVCDKLVVLLAAVLHPLDVCGHVLEGQLLYEAGAVMMFFTVDGAATLLAFG